MTLYAADGSSFTWQIANAESGGFGANFRVERRIGDQAYSESDTYRALSRDTAVDWLRQSAGLPVR
jgi:hypothetical protein